MIPPATIDQAVGIVVAQCGPEQINFYRASDVVVSGNTFVATMETGYGVINLFGAMPLNLDAACTDRWESGLKQFTPPLQGVPRASTGHE